MYLCSIVSEMGIQKKEQFIRKDNQLLTLKFQKE